MTTNEAAERLRIAAYGGPPGEYRRLLDEVLAAERRATVERIQRRAWAAADWREGVTLKTLRAILEEEAAR